MEIQNDFGLTPYEAAVEKLRVMEEASMDKDEELKYKMTNIDKAIKLLFKYDDYVTEARWDAYFNLPF